MVFLWFSHQIPLSKFGKTPRFVAMKHGNMATERLVDIILEGCDLGVKTSGGPVAPPLKTLKVKRQMVV